MTWYIVACQARTVNLWLANCPFENGDRYKFRCKWLKKIRIFVKSRGMIMIILLGNQRFFVSRTYSMGISDSARLLRWAWVFIPERRYELICTDACRLETEERSSPLQIITNVPLFFSIILPTGNAPTYIFAVFIDADMQNERAVHGDSNILPWSIPASNQTSTGIRVFWIWFVQYRRRQSIWLWTIYCG